MLSLATRGGCHRPASSPKPNVRREKTMKKTSTVCTSAVLAALDAEKPERSHWGRAVQLAVA